MKTNKNAAGIVLAILRWTVLIVFLAIALLPLAWLILSSFKTNIELETSPFGLPAKLVV